MIRPTGSPLIIRTDAGWEIGTGHVMRCLAFAQAWQESHGPVHLLARELPPGLRRRAADSKVAVEAVTASSMDQDIEDAKALATRTGAHWILVDGYQFDAQYMADAKRAGLRVLWIDDFGHAAHYSADLVLNQNAYAEVSDYPSRDGDTRLLLGTRYALLRREFHAWIGWRRTVSPAIRRILVTFGGMDVANGTQKVLDGLQGLPSPSQVDVLVGPSNPRADALRAAAKRMPNVHLHPDSGDIPKLMADADLAIAAGGSTSWELAFMGLPSLLVTAAENQARGVADLGRRGISIDLGRVAELTKASLMDHVLRLAGDAQTRVGMSRLGQELVDGRGSRRVIEEMTAIEDSAGKRPAKVVRG